MQKPEADACRLGERGDEWNEGRLVDVPEGRVPPAHDEVQLVDEKAVTARAQKVDDCDGKAHDPGGDLRPSAHRRGDTTQGRRIPFSRSGPTRLSISFLSWIAEATMIRSSLESFAIVVILAVGILSCQTGANPTPPTAAQVYPAVFSGDLTRDDDTEPQGVIGSTRTQTRSRYILPGVRGLLGTSTLRDPGFESGTVGAWSQCGTVNAAITSYRAHSGTYAARSGGILPRIAATA